MPDTRNHDAHDDAESIRRLLPHQPARALQMLSQLPCVETRMRVATVIAQSWARTDINAAWTACSCLSA